MKLLDIENKAEELRNQFGGKIFAFPIHEMDPHSKYAVSIYTGEGYTTFPDPLTIEEASSAILETLKGFAGEGLDSDYERNVRFVSHVAQINAPNVTMRRIRNTEGTLKTQKPLLEKGVDVMDGDGEENYMLSARGLLKWTYIEMITEKNPKAFSFMDEYYKLLAMNRYGRTAKAIKRQVEQMNKNKGIAWIEDTYSKYIHDDKGIINIMNKITTHQQKNY